MALTATVVWECRVTGADDQGGGFDSASGGTDRSTQDSAQVVIDNATITATCNGTVVTFTGGTYTVLAGDKGNVVNMISGSGLSVKRYLISSVSAGLNGTWTLDSTTSMSGGAVTSAKMGGAVLSPGIATASAVASNIIYLKYNASPFAITSSSSNVANGVINGTVALSYYGYSTNRTPLNTDTRPTIQAQVSTITILTNNANPCILANLIFDGNSGGSFTSVKGVNLSGTGFAYNCKAINCTNNAFTGVGGYFENCEATGCSTQPAFTGILFCVGCEAHGNTVSGFSIGSSMACVNCLSYGNTGASSVGFVATGRNAGFISCTAYGNGSNGFQVAANNCLLTGCLAEGNTGVGFSISGSTLVIACAAYNNTGGSGSATNPLSSLNTSATSSFFVNAAGGNFALNNTALAGAIARAASTCLNAFPAGTTVGYADMGGAQHQDTGGGGSNALLIPLDMVGGCSG